MFFKRELPTKKFKSGRPDPSLWNMIFLPLDQSVFFCSIFFLQMFLIISPEILFLKFRCYIRKISMIFAQGVYFVKKAIWYPVFLGPPEVYPTWVISVAEEDTGTLESIVQVVLADLWAGLPTSGAQMVKDFCICFSSRIYGMLPSSIFFGFPGDYLYMLYWVNRRIILSNSLASLVDENNSAVP